MARFTASGAPSGAAACPELRRARVPGTVGPDAGKMFAFAVDTIAAKIAAPARILGLKICTAFSERVLCHKSGFCQAKNALPGLLKTFFGPATRYLRRNTTCFINSVRWSHLDRPRQTVCRTLIFAKHSPLLRNSHFPRPPRLPFRHRLSLPRPSPNKGLLQLAFA